MPEEGVRFMRLLVFFDLPVKTAQERKIANQFRRFLKSDGYDMMQLSVYNRICRGQNMVEAHLSRLSFHLPPAGNVRTLQITDKQYARMQILVGTVKEQESVASEQLLLFDDDLFAEDLEE